MASKKVKKALAILEGKLEDTPKNIRLFSLSLRSLYAEKAVGTSSNAAVKFRKLRDDTRNHAVAYVQSVLPIVKKCISDIKGYFEYYQDLTIDVWEECLTYLIKETKAHKEACKVLIEIHQNMITDLKKRQDEAAILTREMKGLSDKLKKTSEELQASAQYKEDWAQSLMYIPIISEIARPILGNLAQKDKLKGIAKQEESQVHIAASKVVEETLVPAVSRFVEGLEGLSGFFEVVQEELETMEEKGNAAKDDEEKKKMHYSTMKGKASRMMEGCNKLFAVLPAVRTDIEAIPTEGTDQNYVDKWLEDQMAVIKHQCSTKKLAEKLIKLLLPSSQSET